MAGRRRRTLRRRSSGTRRTARRSGDGRTQKARATKEKAHPTSRSGPTNNPGRHGAAGTRSATSSAPARTSNQLRELQQLRHRMDLLTTLVLRHDNQLNINAQDTAYMIFVRTDIGNLGSIMYEAGKKWNEVKETNPEKLESPMRVVLMQKLLLTVLDRFTKVMNSDEKKEQAKGLGWLTEDGNHLAAMRWQPEQRKHVPCPEIKPLDPAQVKQWLTDMVVLSANPRAVNRFMRPAPWPRPTSRPPSASCSMWACAPRKRTSCGPTSTTWPTPLCGS